MENLESLISLFGVVIPMVTIAGSALAFVWKAYRDAREARRHQFFELMSIIDVKGSIASKVAAVYQLRFFPEHKDFIMRFCEVQSQNIEGGDVSAKSLADEMQKTKEFFATR